MDILGELEQKIANKELELYELKVQLDVELSKQLYARAYENSYNALFDGLKYTNTPETAVKITLPMFYIANLYYKTITVDKETGEESEKIYLCFPENGSTKGILTEENFDSVMTDDF